MGGGYWKLWDFERGRLRWTCRSDGVTLRLLLSEEVYISDSGLQNGLWVQLGEDLGHPELSLGKRADHIWMRVKL